MLQLAATTLRKSLRTSDYAFRIGGDEFAILLPQSDTEQASALSRRLRATYAASVEPLQLGVSVALDYGLAVYPDDGDLQEVLIRVADERLYQLKNGEKNGARVAAQPPASERPGVAGQQETPAAKPAPGPAIAPPAVPPNAPTPVPPTITHDEKGPASERRRWERVSLANTRAYALIGEGVERTARVLDLGYGGIALEALRPEEFGDAFNAVLHVPILPPVRVSLRRIYEGQGNTGTARIGCSFVT